MRRLHFQGAGWLFVMPAYRPLLDRFVEKFELDPETGCWNWAASISRKGYGRFQVASKKAVEAHRVSYEIFVGDIPPGLEIDHKCRNRRCVCPSHLRAITHRENTDHDRRKTQCENGHPYTEGSYYLYKTKHGVGRWCKQCFKFRYDRRKQAAASKQPPA